MPSIRQTQSYLRSLFAQRGISPQRRLGQNFLIDLNIHDLIVKAAEVGSNDVILEVGSGTGALTSLMAGRGAAVVAVDVDPAMARLTAEAVAGLPNVRVFNLDALQNKNTIEPGMLDNVRAGLAAGTGRQLQARGESALQCRDAGDHQPSGPSRAVPGLDGRDHSARAGRADVRASRRARLMARFRSWFRRWPTCRSCGRCRRRFSGRVPRSTRRWSPSGPTPVKRAAVGDVAWFHDFVRRVFLHRRKYLRHVLAATWRDRWTKADVDAWLESQGLSGQVRAEALDVEEFLALAHALRERWGELPPADAGRIRGYQPMHEPENECGE